METPSELILWDILSLFIISEHKTVTIPKDNKKPLSIIFFICSLDELELEE
jgi:hypothetical protein